MTDSESRIVRVVPSGPVMVQGPVRIEMPDGSVVESDRFMVAICTCRRSKALSLVRHQPSVPTAQRIVRQAVGVTTSGPASSTP